MVRPLATSPLIELELRRENEHVERFKTQRLAPKFRVSGQLVTLEVMSLAQKSGVWFFYSKLHQMATEPTCRHHRNRYIKPLRIIYFVFGKGQNQGRPLRSSRFQSIRELCAITMVPFLSLSQFDRKLLTKKKLVT